MLKACAICGRPSQGSRCALHPTPRRPTRATSAHKKARAETLLEETICAICGEPGTDRDPLTAGHIIARAHGGPDVRWNYHAEHASCNSRAGGAIRAA